MRPLRLLLAGLLMTPALAGLARADALPPPPQTAGVPIPDGRIDRAIERLDGVAADILERSEAPGMAVAVVRDGRIVHARGFGVRRVGEAAPVDADTVFQLASVSKPIGATVVARQVGAGVVTWDTPVADLLPWFTLSDPWVGRHVTIGDMYAHRSGLPDHAGDLLEDLGFDRRAILERLRLLPLDAFRAHYAYTNFGLTAAAEAVAAASGRDWADLSEETIYGPLGMTTASSRYADFAHREDRAYGHVRTDHGYAPLHERRPDAQSPAGGVSASVTDLARWMILVLGNGAVDGRRLIPADALLPAITAQTISGKSLAVDARPGLYGYGFVVGIQPSGRVTLGHSGAFALGWSTTFTLIPSAGVGIAVLVNAAPGGVPEAVAASFADLVQYGEVERDWLPLFAGLMKPMMAPSGRLVGRPRPAEPAPAAPAATYAGRYDNAYFGAVTVEATGDGLVLAVGPSGLRFPLSHWDGDVFTISPTGESANPGTISGVAFARRGTGTAQAMTVELFDAHGLGTFTRAP